MDLIGDAERNKDLDKTGLYKLLNRSNKKSSDSKFWLQIADMEIEADKILLFDSSFLTWGLVTLQAYKNSTDGGVQKYDDKSLNLTDPI